MGDSVSFSVGDKPAQSAFAERLAAYRNLREQIERSRRMAASTSR